MRTEPTPLRHASVAALALIAASEALGAVAADGNQFCSLASAPEEATRLVIHGLSVSIYPDAKVVTAEFSGCQNVWLSSGLLLAQAKYKKGEVVTYVGSHPDGRSVSCLYESRRLAGSAGDCPGVESFPLGRSGGSK